MAINEPNAVNGSASYVNGTTNGIYTDGTTDCTTHATTNDTTDGSPKSKFDPNFTQRVIDLMSPETKPRHREILTSLIRHVHDFCREVELTQDEWVLGVDYINSLGQSYQKNRNETWRLCDILGVESLVDEINHTVVTDAGHAPTSSAILGPFWSPDTPYRELGASVIQNMPADGELTFFHGTIKDVDTGSPIPNATFDMWQASTNGKYDAHDPEHQSKNNLRGKFLTNANGEFWFYCLKPTEYSIDTSGPSAEVLRMMGRHAHRPAHIHMMVTHDDYIGVTAQLYPRDDPYIPTDTVFATKDDLLLDFVPTESKEPGGAKLDVEFHVRLAHKKYKPEAKMFRQNAAGGVKGEMAAKM